MMKRLIVAVVFMAMAGAGSGTVAACGDKFLLLGRGVRFQPAYAAIHPAAILLVIPPKSVKEAAVRDPRLRAALKMAGHRVEVVSIANLREALARSRYDLILAERADAVALPSALTPASGKPAIIAVDERPAPANAPETPRGLDGVLKTPQPLPAILRLLDDVMTARLDRARSAAS